MSSDHEETTRWDGFAHARRMADRRQAGTPLPDVRIPAVDPATPVRRIDVPVPRVVPVLRRQNAIGGPERVRCARWVYTYQSPTVEHDQHMIACAESAMTLGKAIYWIFGIETAPTTGTRHLQGYLETPETVRFAAALDLLPAGCHLEGAKGDAASNQKYCKKEEHWQDWGAPKPGRGHRTDMEDIRVALDGGADMREISQDYFGQYVRYHRGFEKYQSLHQRSSVRTTLVLRWFYGPTGSGKTTTLMEMVDGRDAFWLETTPTGTWWNGYDGEDIVVMDELRAGWFPHNVLLRILQSAPYRAPCHGAKVNLCCSQIFITTNLPPRLLYRVDPSGALARRIDDFAYVYEILPDRVRIVSKPRV